MQVITIESEAFQKIVDRLEAIEKRINEVIKSNPLSEMWLDNQNVCELLHISKRTLQQYRDTGKIPFSQIGAKIYYMAVDIETFLMKNYNGDIKKK